MRVFAGRASGAIGARLVPRLTDHGHKVIGTSGSPRNAGRAWAVGAGPVVPGLQPARVWRRTAAGS